MKSIDFYTELALRAQTAYAQLYDGALSAEHFRSIADLKGSFNAKSVKGAKYWYYQYKEPSGKLHQVYVGPDNDAVAALRERKKTSAATQSLGPLARAAATLGCAEISFKHARVLSRLGEYGFFKAGGVLIGTHAFLAFGNMLGVRWRQSDRTEDVDFAHAGRSLSIALPTDLRISTDGAIDSLNMGFLPTSSLAANQGGTYLNPNEPTFRLDFLMPRSRDGEKPLQHPKARRLHATSFKKYSMENKKKAFFLRKKGWQPSSSSTGSEPASSGPKAQRTSSRRRHCSRFLRLAIPATSIRRGRTWFHAQGDGALG